MTTANAAAAHRVTYQLKTLWDFDYAPTHDELETLYETAKKNQWNGSTTIDWSRLSIAFYSKRTSCPGSYGSG